MTADDWDRVKQIFQQALDVPEPERERLIQTRCGDDARLRSRVQALLVAHDDTDELLDSPTVTRADAAAAAARDIPGAGASGGPEGPGSRIGPYKLLQQIGEGGFGTVYMAEQLEPIRRRVALKIVKPGMDTKQVIARFEAERQALAMMDHPNIAKVFDAGATPAGRPYFVMELVRGVPITEYCDAHRLSTRERLELFRTLCAATQHAHECGIIHRDLKPSNVLITLHDGTPVPKIIDFGVAKATHQRLTETTLFTEYNQFIGTPAYMSPEQAALGGLEIDRRSDVYSLGVLLYELLTGTTPFDSGTLRRAAHLEVLRILREEEPPKPSTRVSTPGDWPVEVAAHRNIDAHGLAKLLRGDLDWIVMKALEKDRTRRYESATAMADDIGRYFDQEPIRARPPSLAYRANKFAHKHVRPLSSAAVLVLLLGAEGVRSVWLRSEGAPATGTTAASTPALLLNGDDDWCYFAPRPSPDGSKVAYTDICYDGDVFVKDLATGETSRLTTEGYHTGTAWSPDGTRIATRRWNPEDQTLLIDLEGGISTAAGAAEGFQPVAWSPDGSRLAGDLARSDGNRARVVVELATGDVIRVVENARQWQVGPTFSPDGRYVLYGDFEGDNQDIHALDLESLERRRVTRGPERETTALWSPDGATILYENPSGTWAVSWSDGRVVGEPKLIRAEPMGANAWTDHGLYYQVQNTHSRLVRIPVEPTTGRPTGEPEPVDARADDLPNQWARWSPDMQSLALSGFGGEGLIRILRGSVVSEFPVGAEFIPSHLWWSSDGSQVLFSTASRAQSDQTTRTVHSLNVSDGTLHELFPRTEGIGQLHVSPDGATMVFLRSGPAGGRPGELVVSPLGRPEEGRVLAGSSSPVGYPGLSGRFGQPAFSPNGDRILFLGRTGSEEGDEPVRRGLWVVNRDGSGLREVASSPYAITRTSWHPTGRLIAFQAYGDPWDEEGEGSRLWVVSVDGGDVHEIEAFAGLDMPEFKGWSPDGRWLTVGETEGRWEYWVMPDPLEGGE